MYVQLYRLSCQQSVYYRLSSLGSMHLYAKGTKGGDLYSLICLGWATVVALFE